MAPLSTPSTKSARQPEQSVQSPPDASTHASALAPTAQLTEVFSSFQGEGPWVGERQIFARFSHCHLACTYCDTVMSNPHGDCNIHWPAAASAQSLQASAPACETMPNPMSPKGFLSLIEQFQGDLSHHSLSLTGGEPLLYHRFLAEVAPKLTQYLPLYLETSGTQPEFYAPLAPYMNYVAMDIKLPSATGERWYTDEHRSFLTLASQSYASLGHKSPNVFAKVVMNDSVTDDELAMLVTIMQGFTHIPVFIQPESAPQASATDALAINLSARTLEHAYRTLTSRGLSVRVVPQTHKLLAIR